MSTLMTKCKLSHSISSIQSVENLSNQVIYIWSQMFQIREVPVYPLTSILRYTPFFARFPFFSSVPAFSTVQPELLSGVVPDIKRRFTLPRKPEKEEEKRPSFVIDEGKWNIAVLHKPRSNKRGILYADVAFASFLAEV